MIRWLRRRFGWLTADEWRHTVRIRIVKKDTNGCPFVMFDATLAMIVAHQDLHHMLANVGDWSIYESEVG